MTERTSIRTEKVPAAGRTTPGSATKAMRRPTGAHPAQVSREERERLIAVAAYYRAELRGFEPGRALDDWLAAEVEINRRLGRG